MSTLKLVSGNKILYRNEPAIIIKIVDINLITIQMLNTNIVHTVPHKELKPFLVNMQNNVPIDLMSDDEWNTALFRYNIVNNILENKLSTIEIKNLAKSNNVHYSTIYRWIKKYNSDNQISALSIKKKQEEKIKVD